MPVGAVILVEPALAGNLGSAMRVAANFGVPRVELVAPRLKPDDPELVRWACGAHERLIVTEHVTVADAASGYQTLVGTASGRGRDRQPVITPREAAAELARRGLERTALVFGNETSGLCREDLDRCDVVVRVPTVPDFPVLNLTQTVAIVLAYLSMEVEPTPPQGEPPASQEAVAGLMDHLHESLLAIGFLDPANPERILRLLRRLLGRAGITAHEVAILRGICRQILWAARTGPLGPEE